MFVSALRQTHFIPELLIGVFSLHSSLHSHKTKLFVLLAKPVQKYSDKILLSPKTGWSEIKNTATVALTGRESACFQLYFLKKNGNEYDSCGTGQT